MLIESSVQRLLALMLLLSNALTWALSLSGLPQLHAAARLPSLLPRADLFRPTHSASLLYTNGDNSAGGGSVFFTRITVESQSLLVALEDLDHQLDHVNCTESGISLRFHSRDAFATTSKAFLNLNGSTVVTSHAGCNDPGSRAPFLVDSVSVADRSLTVLLSTTKRTWKETAGRIAVEYGHTEEAHKILKHERLRRDQQLHGSTKNPQGGLSASLVRPTSAPSVTSSGTTGSDTAASSSDATKTDATAVPAASIIPIITGSAIPLPNTTSVNLTRQISDEPLSLEVLHGKAHVPGKILVSCLDCKTQGMLNLRQGNWSLGNWTALSNFEGKNLIHEGYVDLNLVNFAAHIKLQLSPDFSGSQTLELFTVPLPAAGFTVPGFGSAGLLVQPELYFDWSLSGNIGITYGFDFRLPQKAGIHIDFAQLNKSSIHGFAGAIIKPKPFRANMSDITMSLSFGLRPRMTLAFDFLDTFTAEAAAFLNAPELSLHIGQLSSTSVDGRCHPDAAAAADPSLANDTSAAATAKAAVDNMFPNFTHITGDINIGAGVDLTLQVPYVDPFVTGWAVDRPVRPMQTACLAYKQDGGFVDVADVLEEEEEREEGAAEQRKKDGQNRHNKENAGARVGVWSSRLEGAWVVCVWKLVVLALSFASL